MIDPLGAVLSLVVPVFEELQIMYYIGGSVASGTHGDKRQTNDVDIVADIKPEHVVPFTDSLKEEFYADEQMIRTAIRNRGSFNLIHFATSYKVDVFPLKARAYDQVVASRRQREIVDGEPPVESYIAQSEDIVLAKLEWFRAGGETSDRQWRDILGVLKLQCFDIDFEYMEKWAREINVSDLLERALDESGLAEKEKEKN